MVGYGLFYKNVIVQNLCMLHVKSHLKCFVRIAKKKDSCVFFKIFAVRTSYFALA